MMEIRGVEFYGGPTVWLGHAGRVLPEPTVTINVSMRSGEATLMAYRGITTILAPGGHRTWLDVPQ